MSTTPPPKSLWRQATGIPTERELTTAEIAARAYAKYLQHFTQDGRAAGDWSEAERELRQEKLLRG